MSSDSVFHYLNKQNTLYTHYGWRYYDKDLLADSSEWTQKPDLESDIWLTNYVIIA